MMSLILGLFTQVNDSGPRGLLVKEIIGVGELSSKSVCR